MSSKKWPQGKTMDRFIWNRATTNFEYCDFDRSLQAMPVNGREKYNAHAKAKKRAEAYKKLLNLPIGPRKMSHDEKKPTEKILFQSEDRELMTMRKIYDGPNQEICDGDRDVAYSYAYETGRMIMFEHKLGYLTYCTNTLWGEREQDKKYWYQPPWSANCLITAIWQHQSGSGVMVALNCTHEGNSSITYPCKIGHVLTLEKSTYVNLPSSLWCDEKQRACHIRGLEVHVTRPIIYFTCDYDGLISYHEKFEGGYKKLTYKKGIGSDRDFFTTLKVSPSGTFLACGHSVRGVYVFNALTLEVAHHLEPEFKVNKAFDWHPWESNLLVMGIWGTYGLICAYKCHLKKPLLGCICRYATRRNMVYVSCLKFHPYTAELVVAGYARHLITLTTRGNLYVNGGSAISVFNGDGKMVDLVFMEGGMVSQMFFAKQGTELIVSTHGGRVGRFEFTNKREKTRPHPYIKRSAFNLLFGDLV